MSTTSRDRDDSSLNEDQFTCEFINSHFKQDMQSLINAKSLHSQLLSEKLALERQLSLATCNVPNQIHNAVIQAEKADEKIKEFESQQEMLHHEVMDFIRRTEPKIEQLSSLNDKLKDLEKYKDYLRHLIYIENLSGDIRTALLTESLSSSVDTFQCMTDLYVDLEPSASYNLLKFLSDTIIFWYNILLEKVASMFSSTLEAVRWPVVATILKPPVTNSNVTALFTMLHTQFNQLLQLQLPNNLVDTDSVMSQSSTIAATRGTILPLELMVKPLCKRFKYHFYGNKRTNNIEKPEWYFTQIITWLRDHGEFLDTHIQPIMATGSRKCVNMKVEFTHSLVKLVMEKMVADMPELLKNDAAFAHLVDEALLFNEDLCHNYGYPTYFRGCLHVLCLPDTFDKWKNLEKKFALEKIDSMLTSTGAWTSQYKDVAGVDNLHVPDCANMFMSLMQTICDRYQSLPDPQCRMDFLDLQMDLLDDFRIRLVQIMKTEMHDPYGRCFTAIMNAVHYICEVLTEWNEQLFFIQLQYERTKQDQSCMTALESPGSSDAVTSPDSTATHYLSFTDLDISPTKGTVGEVPGVEGGVFDDIIQLLQRMEGDMLQMIVTSVFTDVKARSQPYRKDRWISPASSSDAQSLGLSASAYEMFIVLRDHLQTTEASLSPPLFTRFWHQLADNLDKFIYTELILCNKFSDGGAAQLQFDMTRNLFPLFAQFTQKPEAYFRLISEACRVLTLSTGSAILLKDVLYNCLHTPAEKRDPAMPSDPRAALHDVSVFTLTGDEAETLLSLRTKLCV